MLGLPVRRAVLEAHVRESESQLLRTISGGRMKGLPAPGNVFSRREAVRLTFTGHSLSAFYQISSSCCGDGTAYARFYC